MRYIKIYESFTLKVKKFNSCFIIYGNMKEILSVLNALKNNWSRKSNMKVQKLEEMIDNLDTYKNHTVDCIGLILYNSWSGFSCSILTDHAQKERKLDAIDQSKLYKFQGEIKLENGKIVFDSTEKEARKYNL